MRRIKDALIAAWNFEMDLLAKPGLWYCEKMGWMPTLERWVAWLARRLERWGGRPMSRNPREDLRKKRRRQRRQVEWEAEHQMDWPETLANLQRFIDRLPELMVEWTHLLRVWFVVHRTIRNPWQAEAWWRV